MNAASARQRQQPAPEPRPPRAESEPLASWSGASPARELQRQLAQRLHGTANPAAAPDGWSPRRKAAVVVMLAGLAWAGTISLAIAAHAILAAL